LVDCVLNSDQDSGYPKNCQWVPPNSDQDSEV
jgi:hypothetical protein